MTEQAIELTEDDEHEARTGWLLNLSAGQIAHFSTQTILDWMDARREQRITQIRAACQTLRDLNRRQADGHARLLAALPTTEEPTR
ncbi:hypothetical protein [Streptomyces brevispora]|uniref:Uncharacterized protein n=1 Tax=Streptomyces brevispora TaxID=887462 RepID=A0ABZ1G375_9ACTN|nr:hypothetical protein [Streptomyces brevispora]WSC14334.1 hypothetical protein OIE64_16790 [Streptomyces brevispora]